ncbi:preprotein translocase subunit SecG [bacterium]|nr:preprotein translocase subunit SecG [bacterium]
MYGFLVFLHILVSVGLIAMILMQSSKGGGLSNVFGGGGGGVGSVFGGRGTATFLHKFTTGLAISFMLLCLVLGRISLGNTERAATVEASAVQQARENSVIPVHSQPVSIPAAETSAPVESAEEN